MNVLAGVKTKCIEYTEITRDRAGVTRLFCINLYGTLPGVSPSLPSLPSAQLPGILLCPLPPPLLSLCPHLWPAPGACPTAQPSRPSAQLWPLLPPSLRTQGSPPGTPRMLGIASMLGTPRLQAPRCTLTPGLSGPAMWLAGPRSSGSPSPLTTGWALGTPDATNLWSTSPGARPTGRAAAPHSSC